jgi:hypothetical protein
LEEKTFVIGVQQILDEKNEFHRISADVLSEKNKFNWMKKNTERHLHCDMDSKSCWTPFTRLNIVQHLLG